jgi:hypothetical protein
MITVYLAEESGIRNLLLLGYEPQGRQSKGAFVACPRNQEKARNAKALAGFLLPKIGVECSFCTLGRIAIKFNAVPCVSTQCQLFHGTWIAHGCVVRFAIRSLHSGRSQ